MISTSQRPNRPEPRYGAVCARCSRTYVALRWPVPQVCDWCGSGLDSVDLGMPIGSTWVSS